MADTRRKAMRGRLRLPLTGSVALLAMSVTPASHAEWRFAPTVELKETYSDNVALARDELARAQFISEVAPGFVLSDNSPSLKLRASYQLHYFSFSDKELAGTRNSQSQLNADAKASLIDELLYLDSSAMIGQQPISAFAQQSNNNGYTDVNRANVKSYRISPYLKHRFDTEAVSELRYTHDMVDAGTSGLGRTSGDLLALSLSSGPAFRRFNWSASLTRQKLSNTLAPESTTDQAGLNLSYALSSTFSLTTSVGHDKYDYQALGGTTSGKSWTVGFHWTPTARTSLQLSAGKRYYGSTYALTATHHSRNSVWSVNYNDEVTNTRSQFLLPATVDTAGLLDRLFSATIADPVARALAVDAYMRATGLPVSLADNINYFSNRFILQKRFQASVAFNTARSTLLLSLSDTKRNALSAVQTDSGLLGPSQSTLNDDTHQIGATGMANWQMTGRSALSLSANAARIESVSTGIVDHTRAVRLNVTRQFQTKVKGSVELRRVYGTIQGSNEYHENAVAASLSVQL
ncbi:MAG: TIGR03016 family PEP-CTERM system-associated outer membrane protein [Pseudomonadota bacterium]